MLRVTHQRLADAKVRASTDVNGCSLPRPTFHIATVTRITPSRKVIAGPGVSLYTCHGVYSFIPDSCSHPQTHVSLLHGGESDDHIWTRADRQESKLKEFEERVVRFHLNTGGLGGIGP